MPINISYHYIISDSIYDINYARIIWITAYPEPKEWWIWPKCMVSFSRVWSFLCGSGLKSSTFPEDPGEKNHVEWWIVDVQSQMLPLALALENGINLYNSSNTTSKQKIQKRHRHVKSALFKGFHPQPPLPSIAPLAWCAQAWNELLILLQFWGSTAAKEQLLKLVHPFFFVTWASLGPIALRTNLSSSTMIPCYGYDPHSIHPAGCLVFFGGDGMLTCQAQNAAFISQNLLADALLPTFRLFVHVFTKQNSEPEHLHNMRYPPGN